MGKQKRGRVECERTILSFIGSQLEVVIVTNTEKAPVVWAACPFLKRCLAVL